MKNFILAFSAAAMFSNAFAEDSAEANVSENDNSIKYESEYKSFEKDNSIKHESEYKSYDKEVSNALRFGGHFGGGVGFYWDYPSELGDNDWLGVVFDLGVVFKYPINNLFAVAPEVNFGFNVSSRKIGEGSVKYSDYTINEMRTLFDVNIPLMFRYTPIQYFFVEAGMRLNFNLGTCHSAHYDYDSSDLYKSKSEDMDEWKVNALVPSLVFGLGGSFNTHGHDMDVGLRFVLDVRGIEKESKWYGYDDSGNIKSLENNTKILAIQFVFNYYFI